jgi:hypothetical protein
VNLLDSIREERLALDAEHERRVGLLEEMEALAAQFEEPSASAEPEPAAPPPRRERVQQPTKTEVDERLRAAVVDAIREMQPVRAGLLRRRLDLADGTLKRALAALRSSGVITTEGVRSSTVYWITADRDRLEAEAHGTSRNGGTPRPVVRGKVLQAIHSRDGITESQLAMATGFDREQVALATGELLAADAVALGLGGAYLASARPLEAALADITGEEVLA